MAQLVLLVVAAAWAAVLLPPMLRSRMDNRPNSSVTDFRRQLSKLQSTAGPTRGPARSMGRPLAPSPLTRSAAPGRPGQAHHRQAHLHLGAPGRRSHGATTAPPPAHDREVRVAEAPTPARREPDRRGQQRHRRHGQFRSHGEARPPAEHGEFVEPVEQRGDARRAQAEPRSHRDPSGPIEHPHHRRAHVHQRRTAAPATDVKRRRTNVLFLLVVTTACTLFLAATTTVTFMVYAFALSFLALVGYVFLLAQLRQRETSQWNDGWFERR